MSRNIPIKEPFSIIRYMTEKSNREESGSGVEILAMLTIKTEYMISKAAGNAKPVLKYFFSQGNNSNPIRR